MMYPYARTKQRCEAQRMAWQYMCVALRFEAAFLRKKEKEKKRGAATIVGGKRLNEKKKRAGQRTGGDVISCV